MSTTLELLFDGSSWDVPRSSLSTLLVQHRTLLDAKPYRYVVVSSVPLEVFESFVESLRTNSKLTITRDNVDSLLQLANEFFVSDLWTRCASFSVSAAIEAERREFEYIHSEVELLKGSLRESADRHSDPSPPPRTVNATSAEVTQTPHQPAQSPGTTEGPVLVGSPSDGALAYLRMNHKIDISRAGMVVHKGMTREDWGCWDFGHRRVDLTHYTIKGQPSDRWVVEGRLDRGGWTVLDRRVGEENGAEGPFAVSTRMECHTIRVIDAWYDTRGVYDTRELEYLSAMRSRQWIFHLERGRYSSQKQEVEMEFFGRLSE
jgi:hypothetical protein